MHGMWPFNAQKIFSNRWWALAFVVFVCWQAVEITGSDKPANVSSDAQDAESAHAIGNAIKNM